LRAGHLETREKLRQQKMKRSLFSISLLAAIAFHGQFAHADCITTNGCGNTASGASSTVGGGTNNNAIADFSTVAGGTGNNTAGATSTIVGGEGNASSGNWSAVTGGAQNSAIGEYSVVGGGLNNSAVGDAGTIGGGFANISTNLYATVPGGYQNVAGGTFSFAAGRQAVARHNGAFVWADSTPLPFSSTAMNQVAIRAKGGVRIATAVNGTTGATTAGVRLSPGGGAWGTLSDRKAKENFAPVDQREILDKVTALPMATWNYKTQDASVRHIGPTAQDFRGAFEVGEDEETITTVDADGVALAAIQGLNQKLERQLEERDSRIATLEKAVAELKELIRKR
jgi:hypothetical protein